MLGYSEKEMIGYHIWDFIEEGPERDAVEAAISSGALPKRPIECNYERKNGSAIVALIKERVIRVNYTCR